MGGSSRRWSVCVVMMMMMMMRMRMVKSDVEQDKAECMDKLIGLATCLPYVGGESKGPTLECCSGVREVVQKSMKCLCLLVKDKDDPSLGLTINTTLALSLPSSCHAPTNLTTCIDLLHLPLNSTLANLFHDFQKGLETKNTTMPGKGNSSGSISPSNADVKSDGGMKEIWLGSAEMLFIGLSAIFFTLPHHIFDA